MSSDIEWANIKKSQRKILFTKYIVDKIDENDKNNENGYIDNLTYTKNKFFLKTLKKDETYYKNIKEEDIIIKNNIIDKINSVKTNEDGLFSFLNKNEKIKITDYKNDEKKYKNGNYKMDDNGNPVFLIP